MLYDDLPPAQAAAAAWAVMGRHPAYHATQQQRLRRDWPQLADALDRLAAERPPEVTVPGGATQAEFDRYDRAEQQRTGATILAVTALAAWAAAWVIGSTGALVILGTIGAVAALGAIGASREARRG